MTGQATTINVKHMLNTVQDVNQIGKAQAALEERVRAIASRSGPIVVGYQGGGRETMAHFVSSDKYWVAFADSGNRYWNALGVGNPFEEDKTIVAEINPPKSGINRRVSGVFVEDSAGKVYLAHRGRVGGGRKGIGKKAFLSWYPKTIDIVNDGSRCAEMIIIGAMDDAKLIENLAAFTYLVAAFKNQAAAGILSQRPTKQIQPQQPTKPLRPLAMATDNIESGRTADLTRFYSILDVLARKTGGPRKLAKCSGYMEWPARGVYFFMEEGEFRTDTGNGLRIVRVGTHALTTGAKTALWTRLSQHRGITKTGGGNHRGSIFRLIIGTALSAKTGYDFPSWGKGSTASGEVLKDELALEREVSDVIRNMPFLWLQIEDAAGPDSIRGYIEQNAICLLSNYNKLPLDPPSMQWLGLFCNRERIRESGLWNSNHVAESYDPAFLDRLDQLVTAMDSVT